MAFFFGPSSWTASEREAVHAFGRQHGKHGGAPVDEAFWALAQDPRAVEPKGMSGSHLGTRAVSQVLSELAQHWLWMREWHAEGHRGPQCFYVVPFSFWLEDRRPPCVGECTLDDGARIVLVDPLRLLDHWPGHDDEGYASRSADAWREIRGGALLEPNDDESGERLRLGLERWLWEIARATWTARVAWKVAF